MTTHIHDNHGYSEIPKNEDDEHILPFQGNINWEKFMQALRKINYNGVLVYEVDPKPNVKEVLEDLGKNIRMLRNL